MGKVTGMGLMSTTVANAAVAGAATLIVSAFTSMAGIGVVETYQSVISTPSHRSLTLVELQIDPDKGTATQKLDVKGGPITGKWAAEIVRDGFQLCSGGGIAPYEGERVSMSIDRWVGEPCPPIVPGDVARASWEYENQEGHIISLSGQVIIGRSAN